MQPEPSRFIPEVAPPFFSRFLTALAPVPALRLAPLFNQAAAHTRRLSRFTASAGGRAKAFVSSFFTQTIPATKPRLRSRWKAKHFFRPFR